MCETNSKPEEIYQTFKGKSATKSNEKLKAAISYETLYLRDGSDVVSLNLQAIRKVLMTKFVWLKRKE